MNLESILDQRNRKLLLIFPGWSTDRRLYEPLTEVVPAGWDILLATGYGTDEYDFKILRNSYDTIYVLAWSLGVAAADALLPEEFATALIAINGTTVPASDTFGIPEAIYDGTLKNLDARNLKKFQRRMFTSLPHVSRAREYGSDASSVTSNILLLPNPDDADISNLKEELIYFRKATWKSLLHSDASQRRQNTRLRWTRQYVSEGDAIIPAKNQIALWEATGHGNSIIKLPGAHFPDLKSIVASILPDTSKISKSFSKAHATYDANAEAQDRIAAHLMEATLPSVAKNTIETALPGVGKKKILEIGTGTGLFTRRYLPHIPHADITFLDLYPIAPFNIADKEEYIICDGEEWIGRTDRTFDLILSASAVQWFADPRRFFEDAYKHLNPGGALIFSTFIEGNLHELDSARLPMLYRSFDWLSSTLSRIFPSVEAKEEIIVLKFDNLRDALMHLKHTGVKGSHQVKRLASLTDTLGCLPEITLTYRPAYFICRK